MKPTNFIGVNKVLGPPENWIETTHGPCEDLPIMHQHGICISRWRLTWKERWRLLIGAAVWCRVASGQSQPPVALSVERELNNV